MIFPPDECSSKIVEGSFFHGKVSKWLVTPICKTFRPFGRGITLLRGLTMVINHLLVKTTGLFVYPFISEESVHDAPPHSRQGSISSECKIRFPDGNKK